jgi:hypothetical protein
MRDLCDVIPAEAIEAAARANVVGGENERPGDWDNMPPSQQQIWLEGQRVAIHAFLDAVDAEVIEQRMAGRMYGRFTSRWLPLDEVQS